MKLAGTCSLLKESHEKKKKKKMGLLFLGSGTPTFWLGLLLFIKRESQTPTFKILVRTLSKNCQKARPLLTSCMMFAPHTYLKFATCVDCGLRTSHFPLAGVLLTAVSSVAAPFWYLRDHCVYLSSVLSWLIDVCIVKLSPVKPENIRWN